MLVEKRNLATLESQLIELAQTSPCARDKRAALVVRDLGSEHNCWTILGQGVNGPPGNLLCGGQPCEASCAENARHAEERALMMAGATAAGADLVHARLEFHEPFDDTPHAGWFRIAHSRNPRCVRCASAAYDAGIKRVWLYHLAWTAYDITEFHSLSCAARGTYQFEAP